jgi:hypothetical protein
MMKGKMKPFAVPTMVWAMPIILQAVPTMVRAVPTMVRVMQVVVYAAKQIPKVPHMKFP